MRNHPPTAASARRGFTLVEVVVALVLLGLTAGLAASSLRELPPARGELDRLVASARSTALRRAQALELRVDADGRWSLRPEAGADSVTLSSGRLSAASTVLQLRIDALGTCIPRTAVAWDATQCRVVTSR